MVDAKLVVVLLTISTVVACSIAYVTRRRSPKGFAVSQQLHFFAHPITVRDDGKELDVAAFAYRLSTRIIGRSAWRLFALKAERTQT